MSLLGKFSAILLLAGLSFACFMGIYWLPSSERQAINIVAKTTNKHLDTVAESIIPFLLSNQIAGIHESLNQLLKKNPDWQNLTVNEADGTQIYPLKFEEGQIDQSDTLISHFEKPVFFMNKQLASIHLYVDMRPNIHAIRSNDLNLATVLLLTFLALLLISAFLFQFYIYKPVKLLSNAVERLAQKDYQAALPKPGTDEIGHLIKNFSAMRHQIADYQQALLIAKEAAEQASQAKSQFLASMSHELRTPLNAIMGYAQLIEMEENQLPQRCLEYTQSIYTAGDLLLTLVNNVLDLQRIENGSLSLHTSPLDLKAIIDDCLTSVNKVASQQALQVKNEYQLPNNVRLNADQQRIKQVLLNLLINAVKYNHKQGEILVHTYLNKQNQLILSVYNSGRGIAKHRLHELFQPFNRLGSEGSSTPGTGIGLVISKQLLSMMGGSIRCESEENQGATFFLTFPEKLLTSSEEEI